jgi:PIN domain nuclease of toxin-antitoxin system
MILLDTNALLWLESGHRRARPLKNVRAALHVSPASLLEVAFLIEAGRIRAKRGFTAWSLADDDRWRVDEPPAAAWFEEASTLRWTRDPFDRLIAAHAQLRRFRLATSDELLLERLGATATFEL